MAEACPQVPVTGRNRPDGAGTSFEFRLGLPLRPPTALVSENASDDPRLRANMFVPARLKSTLARVRRRVAARNSHDTAALTLEAFTDSGTEQVCLLKRFKIQPKKQPKK